MEGKTLSFYLIVDNLQYSTLLYYSQCVANSRLLSNPYFSFKKSSSTLISLEEGKYRYYFPLSHSPRLLEKDTEREFSLFLEAWLTSRRMEYIHIGKDEEQYKKRYGDIPSLSDCYIIEETPCE